MEMTFMFPQEMGNFSSGRVPDHRIIFSKGVRFGGRKMGEVKVENWRIYTLHQILW